MWYTRRLSLIAANRVRELCSILTPVMWIHRSSFGHLSHISMFITNLWSYIVILKIFSCLRTWIDVRDPTIVLEKNESEVTKMYFQFAFIVSILGERISQLSPLLGYKHVRSGRQLFLFDSVRARMGHGGQKGNGKKLRNKSLLSLLLSCSGPSALYSFLFVPVLRGIVEPPCIVRSTHSCSLDSQIRQSIESFYSQAWCYPITHILY